MNTVLRNGLAGAVLALASSVAMSGASAQCVGNCGTLPGTDGVVTAAPVGDGSYNYISTAGVADGVGLPGLVTNEQNGSIYTEQVTLLAGDTLKYYFNYVTSDGSFPDYAFAKLVPVGPGAEIILFTARTNPVVGDTVPGFGLPPLTASVVLDSPVAFTAGIVPDGGPIWSPLGTSSGVCEDAGCGYTGWIKSTFTVTDAGDYALIFGVANLFDTLFDSGLAFAGEIRSAAIGETPIPAALPLFATGLGVLGLVAHRRRKARAA